VNVFELIFFGGLVSLVVFGSRALGHLFGIPDWILAIQLTALVIIALRWFGVFVGAVALAIIGSMALGHLFGVTAMVFAIPLIALILLTVRYIGKTRRWQIKNPMFNRKAKR
jgi:membrane protein implicated in regulation of membrane protease activity